MPTLQTIKEKLYTSNEYGLTYQDPAAVLDEHDVALLKNEFPDFNSTWHNTCISCQARQLIKYKGVLDEDGEPIEGFKIACKGIAAKLPPGSSQVLNRIITETGLDRSRALLNLKATIDPVAWAELMFGFDDAEDSWYLRGYQKEQLRCTSQNMVIREGRRSGKTFIAALKLLYLALTKEVKAGRNENGEPIIMGPTIMIVTPYQSQILNIFDEMEGLLKKNSDLQKRITTKNGGSLYVKTPFFHMDFRNGASIKGFVSGVGTKIDGSGGGTMRGQNATIIYLDEMDMIPDEILDKVVMPILLTDQDGDVTLIATSTPIGKRGRFYTWCLESPTFKEDHLPSTVLPQWDKMKDMLKSENSEESFRAEYMAEFIEGSHGVFKPSYVYNARYDYRYDDTYHPKWWRNMGVINRPGCIISIGIDWNKNAGTEFCVVAYDPVTHRYFVLERVNVSASEFSSIRWKEEVIRLNYKWKPNHIYADEGYGHTIIEDLKLLAYNLQAKKGKSLREQETTKLVDRLVSFNFSSRIELRSPIDATVITKSGKEFIVENAVRVFEDGIIYDSMIDEQLKKELLNYVVLRRSVTTNKPIYGPENSKVGDHGLDSLMLALGGIQLEQGLYSNRSGPMSRPEHIAQAVLEKRRSRSQTESPGAAALDHLGKAQVAAPTSLQVLQILRQGESLETARGRGAPNEGRVHGRSRGKEYDSPLEQSVREQMYEQASDYRGYHNDTEHLYTGGTPSSGVVKPRRGKRTRKPFRRKK